MRDITIMTVGTNYKDFRFFKDLSHNEIAGLLKILVPVTFGTEEYVLKEGEVSQMLMFVVAGKAKVVKRIDDIHLKMLAILEPGDVFGEMSFFDGEPHNASVVAHSPLHVLAFGKKDYLAFTENNPVAATKLLTNIIHFCSTRTRALNEEIKQMGHWCITLRQGR